LISEWGIGESVDYKVSEDLTCVLQRMRDDRAYYNSLVKNCSNHKDEIDLEKYNKQLKNIIEKMVE
jgi:hypothetical protein